MSVIDDLIAELHSAAEIVGYDLPDDQPGATDVHIVDHDLIIQILQILADGGGGSGAGIYNIANYGAEATPGFDNGPAIQAASDEALSNGGGIITAPYAENPYEFDGRVFFGAKVDIHGLGKDLTRFQCMSPGAGFDFGDVLAGYEAGESYGFSVLGDDIALKPMVVGVRVSCIFRDIRVTGASLTADWEDTAGLWLMGTQNCLFDQVTVDGGMTTVRMDGACATNMFNRCHFRVPRHTFVDFCRITSVPSVGVVPGWNTFNTCILEYDFGGGAFVKHRAGIANLFANTVIYITNAGAPFTGDCLVSVTDGYGLGFGFSNLRIQGCTLGCTPVSSTVVAVKAEYPAYARIEEGNGYVGFDYALQGWCLISGQQYYLEMDTAALDEVTDFPFSPHEEVAHAVSYTRPAVGSTLWASVVDGEDYARAYMLASGALALGDGTANPAQFLSRFNSALWQLTGAGLLTDGTLAAELAAATQVILGNIFGAAGIGLGNANDTFVYKAATGVVGLSGLALNDVAAGTTPGAVVGKAPIRNASGAIVGYVALYDAIT